MTFQKPITRLWRSVELRIAFYKTKQNTPRAKPSLWAPTDAEAALLDRPDDQETLLFIKSKDGDDDVEMCFRPDCIIAKRDHPKGWSALTIEEDTVTVKVGDVIYRIKANGELARHADGDMIQIEADGGIVKTTDDVSIMVSAHGDEISRKSEHEFATISPDGVLSRRR